MSVVRLMLLFLVIRTVRLTCRVLSTVCRTLVRWLVFLWVCVVHPCVGGGRALRLRPLSEECMTVSGAVSLRESPSVSAPRHLPQLLTLCSSCEKSCVRLLRLLLALRRGRLVLSWLLAGSVCLAVPCRWWTCSDSWLVQVISSSIVTSMVVRSVVTMLNMVWPVSISSVLDRRLSMSVLLGRELELIGIVVSMTMSLVLCVGCMVSVLTLASVR